MGRAAGLLWKRARFASEKTWLENISEAYCHFISFVSNNIIAQTGAFSFVVAVGRNVVGGTHKPPRPRGDRCDSKIAVARSDRKRERRDRSPVSSVSLFRPSSRFVCHGKQRKNNETKLHVVVSVSRKPANFVPDKMLGTNDDDDDDDAAWYTRRTPGDRLSRYGFGVPVVLNIVCAVIINVQNVRARDYKHADVTARGIV